MNPTIIFLSICLVVAVVLLLVTYFQLAAAEAESEELVARVAALEGLVRKQASAANTFGVPAATVEWTADHVGRLREFLSSATGQVFVGICGQQALQEAMKEAQGDRTNPTAAGMDALLRFQFNLASDKTLAEISGGSPANEQDTADAEQNASVPVEIRRSF